MKTPVALVLIVVGFVVGVAAGVFGFLYSTGGLVAPSAFARSIAPTLSLDQPTPTPGDLARVQADLAQANQKLDTLATQVAALATALADARLPASSDATPALAQPTANSAESAAAPAADERALFRISEDADSEARFEIEETLMGSPNLVVGTTRKVAGDIIVNFSNPSLSQVGTIAINARTFKTDQDERNQSIRGPILNTREYEFITFTPTELIGLPTEPVAAGDRLSFQIKGDLTIREVTREVTFDAVVTIGTRDRLLGSASAQVEYADFDITVNPPPLVADVGDTVTLAIDFVALKVEE